MRNIAAPQESCSSFRDPSGSVFFRDGLIYRQINDIYKEDYDHLMSSGLYKDLVDAGLLIPHVEAGFEGAGPGKAYKIICPEKIPFISYPYEWSFSQLKAAGLAMLKIEKIALGYGMSLKDASAYNIQFRKNSPVLIDTLSFERYRDGEPWIAYRQFCQHFVASIALMSMADVRLSQLLKVYIDGIPLDLASRLLPPRSYFSFSLLSHIHLHAGFQSHFADKKTGRPRQGMSRLGFVAMLDSFEKYLEGLKLGQKSKGWPCYYNPANYSSQDIDRKKTVISDLLDHVKPGMIWDLGSNTGIFSRLASGKGAFTVSIDADPYCVENNYVECNKTGENNVMPIVSDLVNPSPAIGWRNRERSSLLERGPADTVMALAIIHHLAISNNLPIGMIADLLSRICSNWLLIEFVPKSDPRVISLLSGREDIFSDYTETGFEGEFSRFFKIERRIKPDEKDRPIYLMKRI